LIDWRQRRANWAETVVNIPLRLSDILTGSLALHRHVVVFYRVLYVAHFMRGASKRSGIDLLTAHP
jgi:hypothetical protein